MILKHSCRLPAKLHVNGPSRLYAQGGFRQLNIIVFIGRWHGVGASQGQALYTIRKVSPSIVISRWFSKRCCRSSLV